MKKYALGLLALLFLGACGDDNAAQQKSISGKWKQSQIIANGQVMADENSPMNNITYEFLPDGKFTLILPKKSFEGNYEFIDENTLVVHAGPSNETYTIQKMEEKEMELTDNSKGTLLKFKLVQ